jgi:hypothetical protein
MSSTAQLDPMAVNFLLDVMEAPQLQVTATALSLQSPSLGDVLVKRGYLVPDGYEAELTSHDFRDRPISLHWSEDSQSFGFFDAAVGWTKVDHNDVKRFRIDMDRVISSLTSQFGWSSTARRRVLIDNLLWDLGNCRLGRRTRKMSILFARTLGQSGSTRLVERALQTRPLDEACLLLTSTPSEQLPPLKVAHVISVRDIVDDGLTLDPNRISASLDRSIVSIPSDRIVLLAGGKEVVFFGRSYSFAKGVQQRRIVQLIHDRYIEGEHPLSVDYVVAELGLRSNARIRDFFKKHAAWDVMLFEKDGKCGFVLGRT